MDDARITAVVAEDESLIRLDLIEMLGELGYLVVGSASNGEEAVAKVHELKPDVVLLDVKMPKVDGLSAAAEIEKLGTTAVVMVTAFSQPDLVERATRAGVMAYLVKPVNASDIGPAISVALTRYLDQMQLSSRVEELESKLRERKLVERAKSELQATYSLDEVAAFRWLQKSAMDKRMTMSEVAAKVISSDKD